MLESGGELSGTVYLNVGKEFPASRLTVSLIGVEESDVGEDSTNIKEIINVSFGLCEWTQESNGPSMGQYQFPFNL